MARPSLVNPVLKEPNVCASACKFAEGSLMHLLMTNVGRVREKGVPAQAAFLNCFNIQYVFKVIDMQLWRQWTFASCSVEQHHSSDCQ